MSHVGETFFTVLGCMDGRCQDVVSKFGREKFNAEYADTITEPGLVGMLARKPKKSFLESLKKKIDVSITKHLSKGIIIDGHAECAGNSVDDETHREHIRASVELIKSMISLSIPVYGVFVHREKAHPKHWEVEQLDFLFRE